MCTRAECPICHRPTFKGCGAHVEQVLADVAPADRCQCSVDGGPTARRRSVRSWLGLKA